jgi:quercetin dioxygenase-like cupin family protein
MRFLILVLLAAPVFAGPLPDPLQAGWKGVPVCELLRDDRAMRVLRCSFAPGVGHERHYHAPHFGYALSGGRMRLTDASGVREAELKTGSSFDSEGTEWHEVMNIGDTTVTYLIVEPRAPTPPP